MADRAAETADEPSEGPGAPCERERADGPDPRTELRERLDVLYRDHFDFLWRTARAVGVPPAHLDDVVQEAFVVALRRRHDFEGRSAARTWLAGIVVRLSANLRRKERRREAEPFDEVRQASRAIPPDESAARTETRTRLLAALACLDEPQRVVWVLSELEEMSARAIGLALGVSPNTVSSRLRLARRRMRRELGAPEGS